ncbi:hypothetical protein EC849_116123 [Pseudomonas putida]|uniref:hypothetical protein n=1 Tax=Pseudomonas putida TaxID=303 RepID=UPI001042E4B2|nr:hypothetical protein [Pseudomonas putida]TCP73588.1 hypothetical protein EC849_116123 [Pseudomonas putida]
MAINLNGATLKGCGIGIVADSTSYVNAEGADLSGCRIGAMSLESVRDFDKILELPAGAEAQEIARLLMALQAVPEAQRSELAESSGLFAKLRAIAVDGSAVVANLATAWPLLAPWLGRVG